MKKILNKKMSRGKFLALIGATAISLPIFAERVSANQFLRRENETMIDFNNLLDKTVDETVTGTWTFGSGGAGNSVLNFYDNDVLSNILYRNDTANEFAISTTTTDTTTDIMRFTEDLAIAIDSLQGYLNRDVVKYASMRS